MDTSASKVVLRCRNAVLEFCDTTPKIRLKKEDDIEVKDRISYLPDELIDKILSSLPTKDAVATSILSRQWRRAFTRITRLDFDDSPISHCWHCEILIDSFPIFKMFVDNVLDKCHTNNLTTFRLHFCKGNSEPLMHRCDKACFPRMEHRQLNAWLCFPLTRGVREVDICFQVYNPGKLPSALFGCQTLEVLKLDVNLHLELPLLLCLPNLKELLLTFSVFPDDDFLTRLVSSCPSLQNLALNGSWNPVNVINISTTSLRRLSLRLIDMEGELRSKVVLNVPNLEYLAYSDRFALCYTIGDMNALVEAQVDILNPRDTLPLTLLSLISSLSNVRRLFLEKWCVAELCDCELNKTKCKLPVFHNLVHLLLGCGFYFNWNEVLMLLLNCAPLLEILTFPEGIVSTVDDEYKRFVEVAIEEIQAWSRTQTIPSCLRFHLKRITIKKFQLTNWELEMVRYFLKNALVLEELVVVCMSSVPLTLVDCTLKKLSRGSLYCSIKVR